MISVQEWSLSHETSEAISFIKNRKKGKPFGMVLSWNPPHPPYIAPKEYMNLYDLGKAPIRENAKGKDVNYTQGMKARHAYYAAVSSCDHEFGRLLQALKEEGIEENTIVIFSSDHGEMMGSHNLMSKNVWYEESINIPFIIRWPGVIKPGRNKELFPSYDFMPTILELMNLPIPESVEGTGRASYFLSDETNGPGSVLVERIGVPTDVEPTALGQKPSPYVTEAYRLAKKGVDWRQNWYRGIRTKDFTYVVSRGMDAKKTVRLLYDNHKDKYQLNPKKLVRNKAYEFEKELQSLLDISKDEFKL
jgi:arylsulfatase A-like enzyme